MAKPLNNRVHFDELTTSVRKAAALKAAIELEVFTRLAEGNRSLPAFMRATGLNERAARLLLDALANMGYLQSSEFEFNLSPTAEMYLVKGKPEYYGDVLLALWAWEARGQTARAARTNKPLNAWNEAHQTMPRAPQTWYNPQAALQEFTPVWEEIAIEAQPNAALAVLAFGVEAGLRTLALLQKFTRAKMLVIDQSEPLARLKSVVEALQLTKRVEYQEDVWLAPLPADTFDLVVVDTITEEHSIVENIGILHNAHDTLKMGGWILLRAAMEQDDRRGPGLTPLWGLDIILGSAEADLYTRTEYRGMLEAAGFFDVQSVGERLNLWTARRLPPPPPPPPVDTLAPDFIPSPEVLT